MAGFGGEHGEGVDETGATKAPVRNRVGYRLERRIGAVDGVPGHPVVTQPLLKNPLIVRPDPVAQVVNQFEDCEGLLGRPGWIDEEFESAGQSGRGMVAFHGAPLALRFLALAAACSCASLRR